MKFILLYLKNIKEYKKKQAISLIMHIYDDKLIWYLIKYFTVMLYIEKIVKIIRKLLFLLFFY